MTDRFDKEAAEWDNNPDINLINEKISEIVLPSLVSTDNTILELGAGTGLLTFRSYRTVKEWLCIDMSTGMIDMLLSKVPKYTGASEIVTAKAMYLERAEQLSKAYDWAVSSMTFHHIPDMQSTITCLAQCVYKGLIIVDYEEFNGSRVFHPESKMEGVERHGLNREEMLRMCKIAGFTRVDCHTCFTLALDREGRKVDFPFMAVIAHK